MNIPKDHQVVMPYLTLDKGNEFLDFAKTVFDAREIYKDHNNEDGSFNHAEIQIGDSTIMVGNNKNKDWNARPAALFIYVEDADASFKKALDQGAETISEPSDQEYGRACGVEDPFGNTWWITSI